VVFNEHKGTFILHAILCLALTYTFLNIAPCIKEKYEANCQNTSSEQLLRSSPTDKLIQVKILH
jgi:hypothetical protein